MSGLLLLKVGSNGSGSPPADPPVITITETSLSFPNTGVGQTSSSQSYDVSGVDLIADITVAAPAGYIINLDDSDDDDGPIVLPETAGVVNATTIYVKFKPGSSGNYNGSLSNSSPGAVTKNVSLIASAPAPTIMVSESSFSFANTIVGAYSASQSYVVSGQYLQGSVVITAPTGFIVNQDDSDTNTSPIILNPTAGTLGDTTIYVKFNPAAVQPYSTNIVNASLNASNINIAVSGIGTTPVINASVSSISGLEYHEHDGPSNESSTFRISGTGLTPSEDNLTVTPSTNIEIYTGSVWTNSPFTIPYTGGSLLTGFIYKVRLKAGLSGGVYSETVSISGGGATTKVISVDGDVIAAQYIEATGGTVIEDGDYKVHIIESTDIFEVTQLASNPDNNTIDYFLAGAGAGGGGANGGGGGGAGGILSGSMTPAVQQYPVVIGGGGSAVTY